MHGKHYNCLLVLLVEAHRLSKNPTKIQRVQKLVVYFFIFNKKHQC